MNEKIIDLTWLKRLFYIMLSLWLVGIALFCVRYFVGEDNKNRIFSDFAETLSYVFADNPYKDLKGFYPPIAFLLFAPFALICKTNILQFLSGQLNLSQLCHKPLFIFSFVLYFVINMSILLFLVARACKLKGKQLFYLLGIVLFCGPILYLFFRANIILTVAICVFLFFWLYKSNKRWQRELANLFLALAISIKIYPIILAIIFLKDRRLLDLIKTGVYTILLVFIPFLFIKGGMSNLVTIAQSFTNYTFKDHFTNTNISIHNLVIIVFEAIAKIFKIDVALAIKITSLILRAAILLSVLVLALAKRNLSDMKFYMLVVLCYILANPLSYGYTLALAIYPLMLFLLNFKTYPKGEQIAFSIMYLAMFLPVLYGVKWLIPITIILPVAFVYLLVNLFKEKHI